ncbi:MAG: glycosyltransferase family 4 protein [Proteobacteria bacterium]|nr:glycosyltransferase family 4 protein [Pseudomonadota bacterium]
MKIAYLSHGLSVYDHRFLAKMVERGHRAYLLSCWPDKANIDIPGVDHIHYRLSFPRVKLLPAILHLRRTLSKIKPDVLHTGFLQHHGFYGALSGFHPVLSMPWGSDVLIVSDASRYERLIAQFTLKRADMITCDCALVKNKIVALTGYPEEKIVIFPWGIDLTIFKPATKPSALRDNLGWTGKKVLIMTRQFKPIYGIEYFLDALAVVVKAEPDTRVILAGAGPLESEYRRRITELGMNGIVYFPGWLDDAGTSEHLNAADIYITTSLSDGTSASMLEAMACGLPVVVSDAPSYFEWVRDGVNGFIVPRRNVEQIATCLIGLLQDKDLQQEMGTRNLALARERADWERNFDTLEGIYERLVTQRRQG